MLKEFLDNSKKTPLPDREDPDSHEEQIFDTFTLMTEFLRDPASFPDPYINQLFTCTFPEIGRSSFNLEIGELDPNDHFDFCFNPEDKHPFDDARVVMSRDILSHYRNDPIGVLCQLVSVISVGSDLRSFKLPIGASGLEVDLNAELRSEAYIAQLLHRLTEMARNERCDLIINRDDKAMMHIYPYGLLSLPSDIQPRIIPGLLRAPFPEAN